MTRALALAAAVALAVSGAACTKTTANAPGVRLRQPTSLTVFRGVTLADPNAVKPYLVVANQTRNDLSIIDAITDLPVEAPIKLRTLVLPVEERPTLVAAASLGDDPAIGEAKPDVLVAVASGDSVLQVVETWNTANIVHDNALPTPSEPTPLAVDLGSDVLALAPMPPDPAAPGTARIAALLAGTAAPGVPAVPGRIAVVAWRRVPNTNEIAFAGQTSADLPFEPLAIAAMPDDPAVPGLQTALYVATRDAIGGVQGVAEVAADLSNASTPRVLGARGPTRLVAAARLKERLVGDFATVTPDPASAANDDGAFAGRPLVPRVYAVLDESGCGLAKPIDCGVVTLDASATVVSGTMAIPHGATADSPSPGDQFMPYRAPMRVPGRPLAIAASGPPAKPPPDADGEPKWSALPKEYMRLYSAGVARATTGVAAVASDDGLVYYLDLGRFETATASLAVASKPVTAPLPDYKRPADCKSSADATLARCAGRRLWLKKPPPDGTFLENAIPVSDFVPMTPGWTPDQVWSLVYQGQISTGLYGRAAEAGHDGVGGKPWVALQSAGGGVFNQVARLWDPALGVHEGDLLVIKARALGCTGTPAASSTNAADNEFYVQVASLLAPDAATYPGGALTVTRVATGEDPAWAACYTALDDATKPTAEFPAGRFLTGLVAGLRAGGYVLTGANTGVAGGVPINLGYMGRPQPNATFTLVYENEDALAALCPLEGWNWQPPVPACDAACRSTCERLSIVRKLRRFQGISVDCSTNGTLTSSCNTAWPGNKFPLVASPTALEFIFDVQRDPQDPTDPTDPTVGATAFRDLRLTITSGSNVTLNHSIGKSTAPYQANGMIAFDRSGWTPETVAGYRFLVSYPADFVLDATPGTTGVDPGVIR